MTKGYKFLLFFIIAVLVFLSGASAETNNTAGGLSQFKTAAIIPCDKMIDKGLYESIRRRSQLAIDAGATYLIYDIDTYGGDLFAAIDITNYLLNEINPKVHTVAYVNDGATLYFGTHKNTRKVENIRKTGADFVATPCPSCTMQIDDLLNHEGMNVRTIHPVQILDMAYGNKSSKFQVSGSRSFEEVNTQQRLINLH